MISVEEALGRILAAFAPLPPEQVGLDRALGRVLAADVIARVTQPPVAVSAMDGYAMRGADVTPKALADGPVTLRLIGEAPAGGAHDGTVGPGEAVRIFTGGPVPAGADTVIMQENTERDGDRVTILQAARPGHFVRPAGLDFRAGEVGLVAGRLLGARDIGLAAAMNHPWLLVRRRPRVAILSTGDEIVMPGEPLGANQIVGSNGLALAALVRACGGAPNMLGIAPDSEDALRHMAAGAAGADLLITSGGASVGDHDLVQKALGADRVGLEIDFWRVAMRPGKPLMFGRFGDTPLIGVPGNPVSSLVCGLLYVRPAIERMLGLEHPGGVEEIAVLGADLEANDHRQDYLRASLSQGADGARVATPFTAQDSAMLARLTAADCLIVRPPEAPAARTGEPVAILPLAGATPNI